MSEGQYFKLSAEGRAIIPLFVKPRSGTTLVKIFFKLDTGADITTIGRHSLFGDLDYNEDLIQKDRLERKKFPLSRAGRKSEPANCLIMPMLHFAGKDFTSWPLHVGRTKEDDFPNLLGLDILTHFNFTFNYDKGHVFIKPAQSPSILLPKIIAEEPELIITHPEIRNQQVFDVRSE